MTGKAEENDETSEARYTMGGRNKHRAETKSDHLDYNRDPSFDWLNLWYVCCLVIYGTPIWRFVYVVFDERVVSCNLMKDRGTLGDCCVTVMWPLWDGPDRLSLDNGTNEEADCIVTMSIYFYINWRSYDKYTTCGSFSSYICDVSQSDTKLLALLHDIWERVSPKNEHCSMGRLCNIWGTPSSIVCGSTPASCRRADHGFYPMYGA